MAALRRAFCERLEAAVPNDLHLPAGYRFRPPELHLSDDIFPFGREALPQANTSSTSLFLNVFN